MPKLKWLVEEPPTGRYKSFARRGWPAADIGDTCIVMLTCEDEYIPANVKVGNHAPIKIRISDRRDGHQGFKWVTLKKRAATLAEAKMTAQQFIDKYPEFIGPSK